MTTGPRSNDAPPLVVDARGTRCPQPVIDLATAVVDLPSGTAVRLLADDPATRYDVPAWCRMRGHQLVATATDGPGLIIDVLLG